MTQSTIHAFPHSASLVHPSRNWTIGSLSISTVAILVAVTAFGFHQIAISRTILVCTVATLGAVAFVHARFLLVARNQNRRTSELLWTKDLEYQSIFENALDVILVFDDDGVCQSANPSARIFFSTPLDKIVGQPIRHFYSETGDFDSLWNVLRTDRRYQGEAELVRSDGSLVTAEFTAVAYFLPNRHLIILRDVTRRRRAQQALNESLIVARSSWQEAETLRRASIALTEDLRMSSVLDTLLQTLAQFVPYERAQLFLLETDTRLFLAHEALNRARASHGSAFPEGVDVVEVPIFGKVLASQDGLVMEDLHAEKSGWGPGEACQVRSWIGVPIIVSSQILGLLSLTDSSPSQFSSHHLSLARSLATPAAVAIQNARLYERAEIYGAELEQRVAELRQIHRELQGTENENRASVQRFERIFRSAPVAISVSSLVDGKFLESNEAFEKGFAFTRGEMATGLSTELELWEDHHERTKLIERLGRGARVRTAIARFRRSPGIYKETMYSAEIIDIEGQPCLLIAAEDQINFV